MFKNPFFDFSETVFVGVVTAESNSKNNGTPLLFIRFDIYSNTQFKKNIFFYFFIFFVVCVVSQKNMYM